MHTLKTLADIARADAAKRAARHDIRATLEGGTHSPDMDILTAMVLSTLAIAAAIAACYAMAAIASAIL